MTLPLNIQRGGIFSNIDQTGALQPSVGTRTLLIGQGLNADAHLQIHSISSPEQGDAIFGQGSMLGRMCREFRRRNTGSQVDAVSVADDSGGVANVRTITFTAASPGIGTVVFYIAGDRYTVGTSATSTAETLAASAAAEIAENPSAHYTAVSAAGVVTVTARHAGIAPEIGDIYFRYATDDPSLPPGVTVATVETVAGSGNPSLEDVIGATGIVDSETRYHTICYSYVDSTNRAIVRTFSESRWSSFRARDGVAIGAVNGTVSDASAAAANNHQLMLMLGANRSPTPAWVTAVIYGAREDQLPLVNSRNASAITIDGVLAPPPGTSSFIDSELEALVAAGVTPVRYTLSGPQPQRSITTYLRSPSGLSDTSLKNLTTVRIASFLRENFINTFTPYLQFLITDDASADLIPANEKVTHPAALNSAAVNWYVTMIQLGIVGDLASFRSNLQGNRNQRDRDRFDFTLPVTINGVLVTISATLALR